MPTSSAKPNAVIFSSGTSVGSSARVEDVWSWDCLVQRQPRRNVLSPVRSSLGLDCSAPGFAVQKLPGEIDRVGRAGGRRPRKRGTEMGGAGGRTEHQENLEGKAAKKEANNQKRPSTPGGGLGPGLR